MSLAIWPYWGLREPISAATHCLAFLWAVFAAAVLVRLAQGDRKKQLNLACFGIATIFCYAASTIYHAIVAPPETVSILRRLDQTGIFLLIAGSFTPTFVVLLRDGLRKRLLLSVIWTCAVVGTVCKWALPAEPYWLTVTLYIAVAYIGFIPLLELREAVGWRGLAWAIGGGLCFMAGALIDLIERPIPYNGVFGPHEIFHLCSMTGSFCHFTFMVRFVAPYSEPSTAPACDEVSMETDQTVAVAESSG